MVRRSMGTNIEQLSDCELLDAVDELAVQHKKLVAKMVAHLAEVERRQLHLALGYSSMYVYATERQSEVCTQGLPSTVT